jgi:hypothetical protein
MDGFNEKIVPTETFFLFVDSNYRDKGVHISPSQYIIDFDTVFKNVISVELAHALYGKTGSGSNNDTYINMHIEELNPNITSHINASKGAFTQLPLYDPRDNMYEYNKTRFQSIRRFDKPLMKLSKVSITFLDKEGKLYPITEHTLRFEVTCFRLNENIEEWDNFKLVSNSVKATEPVYKRDPYGVLGVKQGQYNLDMLVEAFKVKARVLRKNGYNKSAYDELKNAFAVLAGGLKGK